ncbi:hypothetical protein X769_22955 [Mesorhizobium sp. LSJC268A00]|nr:hypothetical protein X771_19335 [Mesorhizobium sp. LSJC277A00]ESW81876.1 hypothetical protein X770_28320 [Mesorhizobium sp. LSJC269B00]ESX00339.1 hypothetical protein X769_22955 [Mesorhizobium sp. LSJC268A00]ESX07413.1 hypothetical protein X768_27280 [Mesorhizobium sp. LSJC265A00]ESX14536.1 hypothetical protein X767_29440 [Mesorhizobium sp. LSJC264A00]ESX15633.1 hypothetical protein X766_24545 [Mesorhizobium sp. LSJC255A00]ESX60515.1 hypothetical protein X760_15205 [Mesorhizobium sp. LSHC4
MVISPTVINSLLIMTIRLLISSDWASTAREIFV